MSKSQVLQEWLTWTFSPAASAILVTLLISLLLPILIHYLLYRKAPSQNTATFLLIGPSGAGKTSLQTLFAHGTTSTTHTSQTPQSALCTLPDNVSASEDRYRSVNDTSSRLRPKFILLDTPGHGKLRHHALTAMTSPTTLKGLVFVVDSAAVGAGAGLTETAEYLHEVLLLLQKRHTQAKTSKGPASIPVLVAANKQDVFTSLPADLVMRRLEQEIGRIRHTKSKGLLDSGIGIGDDDATSGDEESNWLGEYGSKQFDFTQMAEHDIDVVVIGGNVRSDGAEDRSVQGWWTWFGEHL